ncbi:MAG: hypothetical protein HRU49_11405 [Winogradskyella sp.]|uniref:carbamoyltransferase family protein n=1 Tax=Winogradskyella sp. TaxID=1883156 RepID=UPI0025D81B1F|nr:carbamoyltransferase N-terminal domain-containing protein [Winogradskyella sp.]NRB84363.1 hypothetical protein [Winogradskyella sp.]
MNIIGIAALYHDSSACLLIDGKLKSAAQEERFTRIKHDKSFPINAIKFCLKQNDLVIDDIDLIVFYEKPFIKFDRIINTLQYEAPFAFSFFRNSILEWTKTKLWIPSLIKSKLAYKDKVIFSEHHEAHAAASFFTSPFEESAILTIDGVGEKTCTSIAIGRGNTVTLLKEQHYPHSIGLLYSAFTQYCGFKVNSGEYKLMGLAPYGKPVYKQLILDHIVSYSNEGVIEVNMNYFAFERGISTINSNFCKLFGKDTRQPEAKMDAFYFDVANSIQAVIEDIIICLANYAKQVTGLDNLCLSGGVALNCKANGELIKQGIFKNFWVQPSAGDAGCAIGAAYLGYYHYSKQSRIILDTTLNIQTYLGPSYSHDVIRTQLDTFNLKYNILSDKERSSYIANALSHKMIIGWFRGKMEFGPRALGNRSILASPLFEDMKQYLNLRIKKREGFRPFAPIVLEDFSDQWFEECTMSKYMTYTYSSSRKEDIPSCIHEDGTARVQTLSKADNEALYNVITAFKTITNCPVLINTSFNVRGEPIVASPLDALKCFFQTDIDILVLEDFVVTKTDNPNPSLTLLTPNYYELD